MASYITSIRQERKADLSDCTVDIHTEIYTSADAVVDDCKARPVRYSQYDLSRKDINKDWHGVDSYDEALELLKNGYQPTVETLQEELKVTPKTGPRFAFSNEVQGFLPIVPLALKGVPNNMIDMRIRPMKAKVLDVYYDMTASCGHDPEEFIKAGKLLLGTIIALEKQGYRFNLYAIQSYYSDRTLDILCVKIKSSDRPIDLKRISFPLTHPAFFRVIGFDWESKSPVTRYLGFGRGCALGYRFNREEQEKIIQTVFGTNASYISCSTLIDDKYDQETLKEVFTNAKTKC